MVPRATVNHELFLGCKRKSRNHSTLACSENRRGCSPVTVSCAASGTTPGIAGRLFRGGRIQCAVLGAVRRKSARGRETETGDRNQIRQILVPRAESCRGRDRETAQWYGHLSRPQSRK